MAVYDRQNSGSSAAAVALPSRDLGSIIVGSLQNAINSIKGEDSNSIDSLKESIKQGINNSSVPKSIDNISKGLQNLLKENTKASSKNNPSTKINEEMLKLLKAQDTREKQAVSKDKPRDKVDNEMLALLKTQNAREKKEAQDNVKAERAKEEKNRNNRHKGIMGKEGFGGVKAIGSTIMKSMAKILLIVFLGMELIAAIKYAWHWLWGVKVPEIWTRIQLWFTGITTRIATHIKNLFINIKNFFTGLWRPVARFFGDKDFGMSKEDKERAKEIEKDPLYIQFTKNNNEALTKYEEVKDSVDGIFKTLKNENLVASPESYIDEDKLTKAIESKNYTEARNLVKPLMQTMKSELDKAKAEGKYDSEYGTYIYSHEQQLEARFNELQGLFGSLDDASYARTGQQSTLHTAANLLANAKNDPGYALYKELESLRNKAAKGEELLDVDTEVKKAQTAEVMGMLATGQMTETTAENLSKDEYYKPIMTAATKIMTDQGIKPTYATNEHLDWIKTTGDDWVNSIIKTINNATKNIGINFSLDYIDHEGSSDRWKSPAEQNS